jgi:hypothetical protein
MNSQTEEFEPFVTAEDGAALLCMNPRKLLQLAREGKVPAHFYSEGQRKRWLFLRSELHQWLKSRTPHPIAGYPR